MANGKRYSIRITEIECFGTSEGGHDEVFMIVQADGGAPIRFPASEPWSMSPTDNSVVYPNFPIDFDYEALVMLYDQDTPYDNNDAEFLINRDYTSDAGQSYTMSNNNGAKYTITVQTNS
jgi:hypothetical protein